MIVQEGIEENLRFLILEVRKQVEKTRKFLARPSRKLLESVRAKDDYIDNLKSIIQRKCFKHAVRDSKLQQAEIDLLKAVEIIAVNLERIADFSENIIGQAGYVYLLRLPFQCGQGKLPEQLSISVKGHYFDQFALLHIREHQVQGLVCRIGVGLRLSAAWQLRAKSPGTVGHKGNPWGEITYISIAALCPYPEFVGST